MEGNFNKIAIGVVTLLIIGAVAFVLLAPKKSPEINLLGEQIADQGRDHIAPGSAHDPYNSNPPTSGPHWEKQATCKVYDEPVADEAAIHSLEHGAVWITYKDKDDKELSDSLKSVVEKDPTKVLLSPRPENDSKIALASWTRLMKLDAFDESQITTFIKSNRNNAPEGLAQC